MRLRIKADSVANAYGVFTKGDITPEMRDKDAQPLVDAGAAEVYREPTKKASS